MAKDLLDGVNDVLTQAAAIDSGTTLTSLTDNSRQTYIDLAVDVLNEVVDELYTPQEFSKPRQQKDATITLVENVREYRLRSDLIVLRSEYGLVDETNTHTIAITDTAGHRQIILGDLEQDDTGLPSFAAVSPENGKLFMDRLPDSDAAGRIYRYRYDRELELESASDEFPFNNMIYRAVVTAATELWKLRRHQDFVPGVFQASLGRAARLLRNLPPDTSYRPRRYSVNITDPMGD